MTAAASSAGSPSADVGWDCGELVITRVFGAPRELVFRAWTESEHFARWWGPHGSSLPFCRMDARPGGALHFLHHLPGFGDVWVAGAFREVAPPERLSFTCFFSDETGGRVERPGFPGEMTITVAFAEHPDGTRLAIRHAGLPADTGEVQGWTEGLDRLADFLADSHTPTGADR